MSSLRRLPQNFNFTNSFYRYQSLSKKSECLSLPVEKLQLYFTKFWFIFSKLRAQIVTIQAWSGSSKNLWQEAAYEKCSTQTWTKTTQIFWTQAPVSNIPNMNSITNFIAPQYWKVYCWLVQQVTTSRSQIIPVPTKL